MILYFMHPMNCMHNFLLNFFSFKFILLQNASQKGLGESRQFIFLSQTSILVQVFKKNQFPGIAIREELALSNRNFRISSLVSSQWEQHDLSHVKGY